MLRELYVRSVRKRGLLKGTWWWWKSFHMLGFRRLHYCYHPLCGVVSSPEGGVLPRGLTALKEFPIVTYFGTKFHCMLHRKPGEDLGIYGWWGGTIRVGTNSSDLTEIRFSGKRSALRWLKQRNKAK